MIRFLFIIVFSQAYLAQGFVDLHMHVTMEVPLRPLFSGHLLEKATATSWESRFKSRVDFSSLENSGLTLVVAALFVSPFYGQPEQQLQDQVQLLEEFCRKHPNWVIVSEPDQAKRELQKGKKIFILSVEGSWFFKDPQFFEKILSKYPIRIVTPSHFTDFQEITSRSAEQRGFIGTLQRFVRKFFVNRSESISPAGQQILKTLIAKKIWIDLSHSSQGVIEYFKSIKPAGYPLLMTHTVLEKYYGTDRGVSLDFLKSLAAEGGVIGLIPSEEMLLGTPIDKKDCARASAFQVQWNEIVSIIGPQKLFIGSDLNSPLPFLPEVPQCSDMVKQPARVTAADLKSLLTNESADAPEIFIRTWQLVR